MRAQQPRPSGSTRSICLCSASHSSCSSCRGESARVPEPASDAATATSDALSGSHLLSGECSVPERRDAAAHETSAVARRMAHSTGSQGESRARASELESPITSGTSRAVHATRWKASEGDPGRFAAASRSAANGASAQSSIQHAAARTPGVVGGHEGVGASACHNHGSRKRAAAPQARPRIRE
eukprot:1222279-Prymnesium_polylepis.2